jgi:hypothetical protein
MESDRKLDLYQEKNQRSVQSSNFMLDSLSIGDFAVLKKNKILLLPIFIGIIIEIPLDMILIPIFGEFQLYETDPLVVLTGLKMVIIRLLISIWFLKILQNTITKANIKSPDAQNLPQFDSLFQSLKKSFVHFPKILLITFLVVMFEIGLSFISGNIITTFFPPVDGILTSSPLINTLQFIIPILYFIITLYIVAVYIHWMILTVFNEDHLKQSFWDSLRYVAENFRKLVNILMIPIVVSIGVSIANQIINIDWFNSVISIILFYFVILYVGLVFGRNYFKYN